MIEVELAGQPRTPDIPRQHVRSDVARAVATLLLFARWGCAV
jgi:hypothetical protein